MNGLNHFDKNDWEYSLAPINDLIRLSPCKPLEENFENFTTRGRFSEKKRKNCTNDFQVLRLQAVITPQ